MLLKDLFTFKNSLIYFISFLNCLESPLIDASKRVLEALIDDIRAAGDMPELCRLYLKKFCAEKDEKTSFVGVLIWYLQELLASMEK